MAEMQEFAPRCIVNIANYAYMSKQSLNDIDLQTYQDTLDTTSPNSPHYCFQDLKLNFDDAKKNNLDPRWNSLKIKTDLCDKYNTMKLCNLYWPCVANAIKYTCDYRGMYNCTTKSCDCFDGFTNIAIRSRPEDTFISCDIGIRALFNHSLQIIPNDFIIDGNFNQKIIKPNQYKLPISIQLRFWSEAYLLDEFNHAINDENATFVSSKQRKTYLPFFTQHKEKFINQNSTLLIGVSMHYVDWDASPDVRVKSLSQLQMKYTQQTPFVAQTKTTRSNAPGWIAINGNGLYIVGDQYWLSNETIELSPKSGIGYTTNIYIEWYSSQTLLKFSTIGKSEIEFEFANQMEISPTRITWIKFIQSNATQKNLNQLNIMIDASFTVKTHREDVIEYFKAKHKTNTELHPPKDISGIKTKLEYRKIGIRNRKYGGMIIGEIRYPEIKPLSVMNEQNISHAFKMGFHKVLNINIKYINIQIDTSGNNKMLNIIIFENERDFGSLYARLKDEEDPITGYLSDKKFTKLLENEMKFVRNQLTISFDSWQIISDNDLFSAWYEISVFATLSEINLKTGIDITTAQQYLNSFKESLFNGMDGLDITTEIVPTDIITYFNIEENVGYKYEAEIKVTGDYVTKIQHIQSNAISLLTDISLNKGYGMVDIPKSNAVSRVSIFATILLDENRNNADPAAYFVGFSKGDTLINILTELLSNSEHTINVDVLSSEITSRTNIIKVTVEFYLKIEEESFANDVIKNVKHAKFATLINEKALDKNSNIFATEVTIIYPSKLNSNVDTIIDSKVELVGNDPLILNQSNTLNQSFLTDAVLPRFMNKYWPIRLPIDIFCSEFYTNLQFGTAITFGYLKQYFCIQLINIIPGQGKVLLKSKLIYKPKQPGAPDELSELCDYWIKTQNGETEPNPSLDEKLKNAGTGIQDTCILLVAGKELMPDNLPDTMGNVAAMLGTQIEIMDLPDIILNDPRPNPKFPPPDLFKKLGLNEQQLNQSNVTNNQTISEKAYKSREIYDKIPPDAYVIIIGIVIFIVLKLIQTRQKRKRLREKMLKGLAEDMDEMQNIAKASKLTAEEYKLIHEKAKETVNKMDFSKYEKRKKRKQKWAHLEEKERRQKKRERLNEIAKEQKYNEEHKYEQEDLLHDSSDHTENEDSTNDDFHKLFESETITESRDHTNDITEEFITVSE
eukprot:326610_1